MWASEPVDEDPGSVECDSFDPVSDIVPVAESDSLDGQIDVLKGSEFDFGVLGSFAVFISAPQEGQKVDPSEIVWPQPVQNIV